MVASDYFSVEVWRLSGLTTYYVLFFIQLSTRTVKIAGVMINPDAAWKIQIRRNITDPQNGMLLNRAANDDQYAFDESDIECRSRLGGMLNYYHREAA